MVDIQKLKYDIAMNCALIDTFAAQREDSGIDIRSEMMANFLSHYEFCCMQDQSAFDSCISQMKESKALSRCQGVRDTLNLIFLKIF